MLDGHPSTSALPDPVGAAAAVLLEARRRGRRSETTPKLRSRLGTSGWEISHNEIEICRRPDGSEWLLGEGRYGRVYKAIKGGVQGGDLREALCADRDIGELQWYRRGKSVMLDVLKGVQILHASHVVHRDIKSKNILLTREGRAKVADVGLAQLQLEEEEGAGMPLRAKHGSLGQPSHSSSTSVGTLAWAAPEVLLGEEVSDKSDVYSLGVVLWELVTLEAPARGCVRDPEVPRECPQGVADAIRACMQLNPPLRPTARELYSLLRACPPLDHECLHRVSRASSTGEGGAAPALHSPSWLAVGDALGRTTSSDAELSRCCSLSAGASPPTGMEWLGREGKPSRELVPSPVGAIERSHPELLSLRLSDPMQLPKQQQQHLQQLEDEGGSGGSVAGLQEVLEQHLSSDDKSRTSSGGGIGSCLTPTDLAMVWIDFSKLEFCTNPDGSRQQLGSGSSAGVYKVLLNRVQPLAAKVLPLGREPGAREAFLQEAGLLWRLRHRNVVSLKGLSIADAQGFLLMELCEGGSLHKMLNVVSRTSRQRVFDWRNRGRHIALDIARGLHYLHSMRVTHFDLKSGNVLITRGLHAKLADVGLARVLSCTHHSMSRDESVGTFSYMAPELMVGHKCTQAVDVYSYGILLWEIISGMHPVRGRTCELRVPKDCPQEVAELYRQCTATDPADRPTARDIVERLSLELPPEQQQPQPQLLQPPAHAHGNQAVPQRGLQASPVIKSVKLDPASWAHVYTWRSRASQMATKQQAVVPACKPEQPSSSAQP